MDQQFKALLPPKAQELVERMELYAGLSIELQPNPHPLSVTDPNPDHLALSANELGAAILFRNGKDLRPHGLVHELLHLERYWMERVPQLVPLDQTNRNNWSVTGAIENGLEHQIIVPREASYGFEPYAYWDSTERTLWGRYPWPTMTNPQARRQNCLLGWLTVSGNCRDPDVIALAEACLRQEKMRTEALHFAKEVRNAIDDKARALAVVVRFLRIPTDEVALLTLDVAARRYTKVPMYGRT